jgi:hypothetical protein
MSYPAAELAALLRNGARGDYAEEAAVGLLIDHDLWLDRSDFAHACIEILTLAGDVQAAFIDWPAAAQALDLGELPCLTSEAAVLRIAAGLAGVTVDLRAMLGGLDACNIRLVAEAVMHANGTPANHTSPPPCTSGTQPPSTTPDPRPITRPKEDRRHG